MYWHRRATKIYLAWSISLFLLQVLLEIPRLDGISAVVLSLVTAIYLPTLVRNLIDNKYMVNVFNQSISPKDLYVGLLIMEKILTYSYEDILKNDDTLLLSFYEGLFASHTETSYYPVFTSEYNVLITNAGGGEDLENDVSTGNGEQNVIPMSNKNINTTSGSTKKISNNTDQYYDCGRHKVCLSKLHNKISELCQRIPRSSPFHLRIQYLCALSSFSHNLTTFQSLFSLLMKQSQHKKRDRLKYEVHKQILQLKLQVVYKSRQISLPMPGIPFKRLFCDLWDRDSVDQNKTFDINRVFEEVKSFEHLCETINEALKINGQHIAMLISDTKRRASQIFVHNTKYIELLNKADRIIWRNFNIIETHSTFVYPTICFYFSQIRNRIRVAEAYFAAYKLKLHKLNFNSDRRPDSNALSDNVLPQSVTLQFSFAKSCFGTINLVSLDYFRYLGLPQDFDIIGKNIHDLIPGQLAVAHKAVVDKPTSLSIINNYRETIVQSFNQHLLSIKILIKVLPDLSEGVVGVCMMNFAKESDQASILVNNKLEVISSSLTFKEQFRYFFENSELSLWNFSKELALSLCVWSAYSQIPKIEDMLKTTDMFRNLIGQLRLLNKMNQETGILYMTNKLGGQAKKRKAFYATFHQIFIGGETFAKIDIKLVYLQDKDHNSSHSMAINQNTERTQSFQNLTDEGSNEVALQVGDFPKKLTLNERFRKLLPDLPTVYKDDDTILRFGKHFKSIVSEIKRYSSIVNELCGLKQDFVRITSDREYSLKELITWISIVGEKSDSKSRRQLKGRVNLMQTKKNSSPFSIEVQKSVSISGCSPQNKPISIVEVSTPSPLLTPSYQVIISPLSNVGDLISRSQEVNDSNNLGSSISDDLKFLGNEFHGTKKELISGPYEFRRFKEPPTSAVELKGPNLYLSSKDSQIKEKIVSIKLASTKIIKRLIKRVDGIVSLVNLDSWY
jgi:hypothetical protein